MIKTCCPPKAKRKSLIGKKHPSAAAQHREFNARIQTHPSCFEILYLNDFPIWVFQNLFPAFPPFHPIDTETDKLGNACIKISQKIEFEFLSSRSTDV